MSLGTRGARASGGGCARCMDTVGPADQPDTSIVLYPPAATPGITDDERRTVAR